MSKASAVRGLVSIRNALQLLGARVHVTTAPAELEGADAILVPGVGASEPAMARLRKQGLVEPIIERVSAGTWYIGICLGLQLLFERSHEDDARMLGLLAGDVVRLEDAPSLPHIDVVGCRPKHRRTVSSESRSLLQSLLLPVAAGRWLMVAARARSGQHK